MSYIEPPTLSNIRKRKRAARSASAASSIASSRHHLPQDTIDPHSYGPSARRQLAVAGLSHSDQLPRDYLDDFPHRPLPAAFGVDPKAQAQARAAERERRDDDAFLDDDAVDSDDSLHSQTSASGTNYGTTEDESGDGDPATIEARKLRKLRRREARRRRNAARTHRIHDRHVGMLVGIIQRGLQAGEHGTRPANDNDKDEPVIGLAHAKRAFALLVRTEIRGQPVDLRKNYLWAMGAEILMRDGEEACAHDQDDGARTRRRWGAAANIPQVRSFYENLIQLHPYNRLWPRSIGALTFWPIMIGTELYSIYAEAQLATDRLAKTTESGKADADDSESDSKSGSKSEHQHSDATRRAREDVRLSALEQTGGLARRMDGVMSNAPYSASPEMLRLRGMIALYTGDLHVVTLPCTEQEAAHGRRARMHERQKARGWFARLLAINKDIQSGRQLSKKKGGTGLPDTMVDDYIRKMAKKRSYREGEEEEEDDKDGMDEGGDDYDDDDSMDEGDDEGEDDYNNFKHDVDEDSDGKMPQSVPAYLPIRNM